MNTGDGLLRRIQFHNHLPSGRSSTVDDLATNCLHLRQPTFTCTAFICHVLYSGPLCDVLFQFVLALRLFFDSPYFHAGCIWLMYMTFVWLMARPNHLNKLPVVSPSILDRTSEFITCAVCGISAYVPHTPSMRKPMFFIYIVDIYILSVFTCLVIVSQA